LYIWLVLDFFLYLGLALWFDNILPNEHGVRRPWYYFVTPSYWTGKVSARAPQPHDDTPPVLAFHNTTRTRHPHT
jgi:hypothetical protein